MNVSSDDTRIAERAEIERTLPSTDDESPVEPDEYRRFTATSAPSRS